MSLIQIEHISKYFSAEPVLADVSLDIRPGDRIGLIGPNGCGKSTLLRIIAGELDADRGEVRQRRNIRIGYLRQSYSADWQQSVWDYAHSAFDQIIAWQQQSARLASELAAATDLAVHVELARQFDDMQQRLHLSDGFQIDYKIERILCGLGFDEAQFQQAVGTLSGGQVNRLLLAHLLLSAPDVMLLDEPSNHLDINATEWLEDFLRSTSSAFVVVSHDRYLLDRVTEQTLELMSGSIDAYPGNYSKYVRLKADRLEVQRRTYQKQQIEIERMEDFVRRNHYGQKASQAEDRRKKLAQIERVERPRELEAPPMAFPAAARCGDIVLRVRNLGKSFDRPLFSQLSFQIERGQRWGILGANGAGKTSLLRCLLGTDTDYTGQLQWGAGVEVGYLDQQLACVADEVSALEAVRPPGMDFTEQARRDLLARFGVTGDSALQEIRSLSGGQRSRVALARLAACQANVLIMDEPTNHLDLWSREALAAALSDFDGSLLIVSHDRYFINQLCDHLLVFDLDRIRVVDGNYDTYRMMAAEKDLPSPTNHRPMKRAADSGGSPSRPKRRFAYRKVEEIEAEIAERERVLSRLHAELSSPDVLRSRDRVLSVRAQVEEETARLQTLYEHWNEACELN